MGLIRQEISNNEGVNILKAVLRGISETPSVQGENAPDHDLSSQLDSTFLEPTVSALAISILLNRLQTARMLNRRPISIESPSETDHLARLGYRPAFSQTTLSSFEEEQEYRYRGLQNSQNTDNSVYPNWQNRNEPDIVFLTAEEGSGLIQQPLRLSIIDPFVLAVRTDAGDTEIQRRINNDRTSR